MTSILNAATWKCAEGDTNSGCEDSKTISVNEPLKAVAYALLRKLMDVSRNNIFDRLYPDFETVSSWTTFLYTLKEKVPLGSRISKFVQGYVDLTNAEGNATVIDGIPDELFAIFKSSYQARSEAFDLFETFLKAQAR